MRTKLTQLSGLVFAGAILFFGIRHVGGGHPRGPQRHPPERRAANMAWLRFQDALATGRWDEALALCSDRVRTAAAKSATPKEFFSETMPIEHVLEHDFGCWSCGTNFYGMFVTLSEAGVEPRIDWHWGMIPTERGWLVDYPVAKLSDYIPARRSMIRRRDERIQEIRSSLEPRVKAAKTRLSPVSERFVIGAPMLFRLELVNEGADPIHYMDTGARHKPLLVLNEKKEQIHYQPRPMQIQVQKAELAARSSVIVAERIDINAGKEIIRPGKYTIQYDSSEIALGQPTAPEEMGRYGETLPTSVFDFIVATNGLPSNVIEIDVKP